jgi:hypothetical protein
MEIDAKALELIVNDRQIRQRLEVYDGGGE